MEPIQIEGMTLRDWFAGMAMMGSMVNNCRNPDMVRLSHDSYEIADRMLIVKSKHKEPNPGGKVE